MFKKSKKSKGIALENRSVSFAATTPHLGHGDSDADQIPDVGEAPSAAPLDDATSTTTTGAQKKSRSTLQKLMGSKKSKKNVSQEPTSDSPAPVLSEAELVEEELQRLEHLRTQTRDYFSNVLRDLAKKTFIEHSKHYVWKHQQISRLLAQTSAESEALGERSRQYLERLGKDAERKASSLAEGHWKLTKGFEDLEIARVAQALAHTAELVNTIFGKSNDRNEIASMELQLDHWLSDKWLSEHDKLNADTYRTMGVLKQNRAIVTHFDELVTQAAVRGKTQHYNQVRVLSEDIQKLHEHIKLSVEGAFDSFKFRLLEVGGHGEPATDVNSLVAPSCIVRSIKVAMEARETGPINIDPAADHQLVNQLLYRSLKRPKLPVGAGFTVQTTESDWRKIESQLDGRWGNSLLLQRWLAASLEWQLMDVATQHQLHQDRVRLEDSIAKKKRYIMDIIEQKLADFWMARAQTAAGIQLEELSGVLEDAITHRGNMIVTRDHIEAEMQIMRYEDERMQLIPPISRTLKRDLNVEVRGLQDISEIDGIMATLQEIRKLLFDHHDLVNDLVIQKYVEQVYSEIKLCEGRLRELQNSTIARKGSIMKRRDEAVAKKQKLLEAIEIEEAKIEQAKQAALEATAITAEVEELKNKLQSNKKRQKEIVRVGSGARKETHSIATWFGHSSKPVASKPAVEDSPQLMSSVSDCQKPPSAESPMASPLSPLVLNTGHSAVDIDAVPATLQEEAPGSPASHSWEPVQLPADEAEELQDAAKKKKKTIWRKIVGGGGGGSSKKQPELHSDARSEITDLSSAAARKKKASWSRWFAANSKAPRGSDSSSGLSTKRLTVHPAVKAGAPLPRHVLARASSNSPKGVIHSDYDSSPPHRSDRDHSGLCSLEKPPCPRSLDSKIESPHESLYPCEEAEVASWESPPNAPRSSSSASKAPPRRSPRISKLEDSLAFSHAGETINEGMSIFKIYSESDLSSVEGAAEPVSADFLAPAPSGVSLNYSPLALSSPPMTYVEDTPGLGAAAAPASSPRDAEAINQIISRDDRVDSGKRICPGPPPAKLIASSESRSVEAAISIPQSLKTESSDPRQYYDRDTADEDLPAKRRQSKAHFHPNTAVVYVDTEAQFTADDVLPFAEDLRASSSSGFPKGSNPSSPGTPSDSSDGINRDSPLTTVRLPAQPVRLVEPSPAPSGSELPPPDRFPVGSIPSQVSSDAVEGAATSFTEVAADNARKRESAASDGTWFWTEERDRRKLELEKNMEEHDNISERLHVTLNESSKPPHAELSNLYKPDRGSENRSANIPPDLWASFRPSCCFNERERALLDDYAVAIDFAAGDILCSTGTTLDRVLVILEGEAQYKQSVRTSSGKDTVMAGAGVFEEELFEVICDGKCPEKAACEVVTESGCTALVIPLDKFRLIWDRSTARVRQEIARILIAEPAFSGVGWPELVELSHRLTPSLLIEKCAVANDSIYIVWQGMIVATDLSDDRREQYYECDVFSREDFTGAVEIAPQKQFAVYFALTEKTLRAATGLGLAELRDRRKDKVTQDMTNMDSVSVLAEGKKKKKKKGISGVVSSTVKFLGGKKKHSSSRSAVGGVLVPPDEDNLSDTARKSL